MSALCWKELREHYRWAVMALMCLAYAQWEALGQQESYSVGYTWNGEGILLNAPAFLAVTTFGCAAVGLLLGLVQILPELRRDQWAALLHRPVSRGTVFRGKVAGGLLLYVLATVPPFLLSVWRVATPGHFGAPFVPGMALAGVADLCAGAAFYFAALALALPRGGGFGGRVLPLLAAVHVVYFVRDTELFRVAVEAAVAMGLLLFTAGWAILRHQDRFSARPWLGRAAGLAVAFYGVCGLGDLARAVFDVIGPTRHSRSVQYSLADTGEPLRLTYVDDVVTSVTDPDGQPYADRRLQPDQVRSHLSYPNWFSQYIGDAHGWHPPGYHESYRDFFRYATFIRAYVQPRPEQWFYLPQQKVWVAWSPTRKVPLERLDEPGFAPLDRPPVPFGPEARYDELNDRLILYNPAGVRFVTLPRRRIANLELPGPGPIYGVNTAYSRAENNRSVSIFGVTLSDRLAVYDEEGHLAATLPFHQDVSRWGWLSLAMTGDKERFYLRYEPSAFLPGPVRDNSPSYLEVMNAQGELLQTYILPPVAPPWQSRSWSEYVAHRLQSPAFFFGSMVYRRVGALCGSQRLADQLNWRLGPDRDLTKRLAGWVLGLAAASAAGVGWWARRAGFSARRVWAWSLFALGFGVAGLVVFRTVADWPQTVPCPRCRRARRVDEARCPHCGADWPTEPTDGTEIFDRQPAVAAPAGARA